MRGSDRGVLVAVFCFKPEGYFTTRPDQNVNLSMVRRPKQIRGGDRGVLAAVGDQGLPADQGR